MEPEPNVIQAVPFFWVTDIETSLRFYMDGLGFEKTREWIDQGKLRWCWLQLGGAALMLQECRPSHLPAEKRGEGVSVCFQCRDALAIYHGAIARGTSARTPFGDNAMWVAIVFDPDGYKPDFESPTGLPEETVYTPQTTPQT